MAKAGDEIVNPVTGHRIFFRKTAQDTDGELLQMDWIGRPGWKEEVEANARRKGATPEQLEALEATPRDDEEA
jgi:hypothetical protein